MKRKVDEGLSSIDRNSEPIDPFDTDEDVGSMRAAVSPDEPVIPAIEFRNVHFSYEDKTVLNDVTFSVRKGEIKINLKRFRRREIYHT